MKKVLSMLICISVFCTMFAGCGGDVFSDNNSRKLRVLIDYADSYLNADEKLEPTVQLFMDFFESSMAQDGHEIEVEWELIPFSSKNPYSSERKIALTKAKTDLMAGSGADVYLCVNPDPNNGQDVGAVFPYVKRMMRENYFLPLDEYIADLSSYAKWDSFCQPVMAAGRTEQGQVVVPILYDLALSHFEYDESTAYPDGTTWDDIAKSSDPILHASADVTYKTDVYSCNSDSTWFSMIFGEYVDYESGSLDFTEDELLKTVMQLKDIAEGGLAKEAPTYFSGIAQSMQYGVYGSRNVASTGPFMNGMTTQQKISIVPLYNTSGGTTAVVKAYCAVNSSTKDPESAFRFVDFMLSRRNMGKSGIYRPWMNRLLIDTPFMEDYMVTQQIEQLEKALGQISETRFGTPLDSELSRMAETCRTSGWDENDIKPAVRNTYIKMQMLLAEA